MRYMKHMNRSVEMWILHGMNVLGLFRQLLEGFITRTWGKGVCTQIRDSRVRRWEGEGLI